MLDKITSNNRSSFNIDFILKSNCNFCWHLLYLYQLRFLCSLLKIVLQSQYLHNSHTGHCYVMSFAAGKRLDVIITIMKTVQCYVLCPQVCKRWGQNFFAREIVPFPPTFKTVALPLPGWNRESKICTTDYNLREWVTAKSNLAPPPKKHAPRLHNPITNPNANPIQLFYAFFEHRPLIFSLV